MQLTRPLEMGSVSCPELIWDLMWGPSVPVSTIIPSASILPFRSQDLVKSPEKLLYSLSHTTMFGCQLCHGL